MDISRLLQLLEAEDMRRIKRKELLSLMKKLKKLAHGDKVYETGCP